MPRNKVTNSVLASSSKSAKREENTWQDCKLLNQLSGDNQKTSGCQLADDFHGSLEILKSSGFFDLLNQLAQLTNQPAITTDSLHDHIYLDQLQR